MSYTFSRALVEEYSQVKCSDIDAYVLSKSTSTPDMSSSQDKTTRPSIRSPFGMTFALLTATTGAALLMWWWGAFPAKTSQESATVAGLTVKTADSGQKWQGLLARFDPASFTLKTAQCSFLEDSTPSCLTLPNWGLMRNGDVYQHPLSALPTTATVSGLLPTPLATDWKGGTSSIRKDKGTQRLDQFRDWIKSVHGLTYPIPEHSEAVMGWPIGHTDLKPLAMDRFPTRRQQPSDC